MLGLFAPSRLCGSSNRAMNPIPSGEIADRQSCTGGTTSALIPVSGSPFGPSFPPDFESVRWSLCPAERWVVGTREPSTRETHKTTLRKRLRRPREREPCRSLLATGCSQTYPRCQRSRLEIYEQNTNMSSRTTPLAGGFSATLSAAIGAPRPWPWRCRARRESRHRRRCA